MVDAVAARRKKLDAAGEGPTDGYRLDTLTS